MPLIIKCVLGIKCIFPCSFGNKPMHLLTHVSGMCILKFINLYQLAYLFVCYIELTSWEVDMVGVDLMGVDIMELISCMGGHQSR